jgi:hypothetical protein
MYEVKLFMDGDVVHYVKTDEEGLENIRIGLDDDSAPNFIEVFCFDNESTFAVSREKVNAFSYKEVAK